MKQNMAEVHVLLLQKMLSCLRDLVFWGFFFFFFFFVVVVVVVFLSFSTLFHECAS